jgi:hypothetical protein
MESASVAELPSRGTCCNSSISKSFSSFLTWMRYAASWGLLQQHSPRTCLMMSWESPLTRSSRTPRDRATVSLKIKASYSAMLLVASKSRSTIYFTCLPLESMRTTPAPAFLLRADPSKKSVQWGPVNRSLSFCGGGPTLGPDPLGHLVLESTPQQSW